MGAQEALWAPQGPLEASTPSAPEPTPAEAASTAESPSSEPRSSGAPGL